MAIKKTSLYLDDELLKELKLKAIDLGCSTNDIYLAGISLFLSSDDKISLIDSIKKEKEKI